MVGFRQRLVGALLAIVLVSFATWWREVEFSALRQTQSAATAKTEQRLGALEQRLGVLERIGEQRPGALEKRDTVLSSTLPAVHVRHQRQNAEHPRAPDVTSVAACFLSKVQEVDIHSSYGTEGQVSPNGHLIPTMIADSTCGLLRAAASCTRGDGVVVEFGTWIGHSSRCLVLGLRDANVANAYFAFDAGVITDPHVFDRKPEYAYFKEKTKKEHSLTDSWKEIVQGTYPSANYVRGGCVCTDQRGRTAPIPCASRCVNPALVHSFRSRTTTSPATVVGREASACLARTLEAA